MHVVYTLSLFAARGRLDNDVEDPADSFFGFGPNFIKLLETLGNNRTVCIAFEDGSHSAEIALNAVEPKEIPHPR
jgi:hypothetical protein